MPLLNFVVLYQHDWEVFTTQPNNYNRIFCKNSWRLLLLTIFRESSIYFWQGPKYKSDFVEQKQSSRGVLWKKVFLKILKSSQENICTGASFLIKLQASRIPILQNIFERLLVAEVLQ